MFLLHQQRLLQAPNLNPAAAVTLAVFFFLRKLVAGFLPATTIESWLKALCNVRV